MNNDNNILKPVFVISSGRSGSTLLQRYLNSSDDLIIWGEHGGFIQGLSETYYKFINTQYVQDLLKAYRKKTNLLLSSSSLVGVDIEWTNNFTLDDWRKVNRDLLVQLFTIDVPPSNRWGFKEIRYGAREIRWLKELFPQSQFIFLVRHPIDTLTSMIAAWFMPTKGWNEKDWNQDREGVQKFLTRHCSRIIRVSNGIIENLDDGYLIKFEDLQKSPSAILSSTCSFLNVVPPSHEKTISLSSDIRKATNKKGIKEILYNSFAENENFQKVCDIYASFGYSCENL